MSFTSPDIQISRKSQPSALASFCHLPNELVFNIVSQIRTRHGLKTLRLFSRVLNEMVKDRVTDRLSLVGRLDIAETMQAIPNTFDHACGTLHIEDHDYPDDHYAWIVLSALVAKMKGLHTIKWVVGYRVDLQLLHSISQLPLLKSLTLEFRSPLPGDLERLLTFPSSAASKLKSLSIQFNSPGWDAYRIWNAPYAKAVVCYFVANAPALEHLHIGKPAHRDPSDAMFSYHPRRAGPLDLGPLFTHLQRREGFVPALRSLSPMAIQLPLSPHTVTAFSKLSTLQVSNHVMEHQPIWPKLQAAGICLETIAVQWLSPELIQYLQSYHGLKVFHLDISSPSGEYTPDQAVQSLWTLGLAGHQTTLKDLRFWPSQGKGIDDRAAQVRPNTVLWGIPAILTNLQPFNRLERLDLIHYAVDIADTNERNNLDANIRAIVSHDSSNLAAVHLNFIGMRRHLPQNPYHANPTDDFLRTMDYLVQELKIQQNPSTNWKQLDIIIGVPKDFHVPQRESPLPLHRFLHYIIQKGEGVYGLQKDLDATLLLNESGVDDEDGERVF